MEVERQLKKLATIRASILLELNNLLSMVEGLTDDTNIAAVMAHKEDLTKLQDKFSNIQTEIYSHLDVDSIDRQKDILRRYQTVTSAINTILMRIEIAQRASMTTPQPSTSRRSNFDIMEPRTLPLLEFPSFYGQYSQWTDFKTKFWDLVGNKREYSSTTKYFYLDQSMKCKEVYFQISLVSESRSRTSRSIFESRISVSENRDFVTRYEIFFILENSLILMEILSLARNFFP
jgi:hypothetical protein